MRYSRLLVGFTIIALALWVIVGEQMSGASGNAVVNAQLSTLRAPLAGTISLQDRALGSAVTRSEDLAAVSDAFVDSIRLNDLALEQALATAEAARAADRLRTLDLQLSDLSERTAGFQAARVAEINVRLSHARERLRLLQAANAGEEPTDTVQGGQPVDLEERVDPLALSMAQEHVDVLEIALRSAESGVFLGDGYNDAPASEQRRVVLAGERDNLMSELGLSEARLTAVTARLDQERLRTNLLGDAVLKSTVNGQIWEVLAADGETVQRGQDVLRLVDCDRVIVTLSVSENVYNRLNIGDDAVFRLSGDGRSFDGTIIRMAGSGAATIYRNLAVAPSQRHLERFDVALLVPALRNEPTLRCNIGRTGRVFFETRPLDWLRGLWN
jgi:multidrug resistance efflux pump